MTSESANRRSSPSHSSGHPYMIRFVRVKSRQPPPSIAYEASVKGGSRESQQGDVRRQLLADEPDRFENETQIVDVPQGLDPRHIVLRANGIVNRRTVSRSVFQVETHRLQDREQVGKQDGRVDAERSLRGERHLGSQLGALAQFEKRHFAADGPVLRQIPARLPHDPDRSRVSRFTPRGCAESGIVGVRGSFRQVLRQSRF